VTDLEGGNHGLHPLPPPFHDLCTNALKCMLVALAEVEDRVPFICELNTKV